MSQTAAKNKMDQQQDALGQFHMRNVKIIVFKTVFLIELLPAVHCRHVKVYCKMFFIALGKTALRGGHKVCMC